MVESTVQSIRLGQWLRIQFGLGLWSSLQFCSSLRESLYFSQDNRSGKILHLTRPHQVLPDWSVLI